MNTGDEVVLKIPDDVLSLIANRIKRIAEFYDLYFQYFRSYLHNHVVRYSLKDTTTWTGLLAEWRKLMPAVVAKSKAEFKSDIMSVLNFNLELYNMLERLDSIVLTMRNIVNKPVYTELMLHDVPVEVKRDNVEHLEHLDFVRALYRMNYIKPMNDALFEFIDKHVHFVKNLNIVQDTLVTTKLNDLVISAFKNIIEGAEPKLTKRIVNRLEYLKDAALVRAPLQNICLRKYIGGRDIVDMPDEIGDADDIVMKEDEAESLFVQQTKLMLLMREEIMAYGDWMTIEELFAKFNGEYSATNIHINLRRLCLLADANILIIHNTRVNKLIEYDFEAMNVPENITTADAGASEKLLRRFNTVRVIDIEELKSMPTLDSIFSIYWKTIEDDTTLETVDDEPKWLIIECVNFRRYRIMKPNNESNDIFCNDDIVRKTLAGVDMRTHNINTYCENAMSNKAISRKHRAFISKFESAVENRVLAESVKVEIIKEVNSLFLSSLNAAMKKQKDFISIPRDFYDFITSEDFVKALRSKISSIIYTRIQKPKREYYSFKIEIGLSYALASETVVTKFMREYETSVSIIRNNAKVLQQNLTSDAAMVRYLAGWFEQIIEYTMPIVDTTPGNLDEVQFNIKEYFMVG